MQTVPRGQAEDSPATAELPEAEETVEARGDLQDQAFKWLFALRISLGSRRPAPLAARRRGLWDGAKLTPQRPPRMSFTAISIPALPTFLRPGECGGGFRHRPSLRGGWVRVLARGSAEQGQWIFPGRIQGSLP